MEVRPHASVHSPRACGVGDAVVAEAHPDCADKHRSSARRPDSQAGDAAAAGPAPEGDGCGGCGIVVHPKVFHVGGGHRFQLHWGARDMVFVRRSQAGGRPAVKFCRDRGMKARGSTVEA